jgi:hypothetical protein
MANLTKEQRLAKEAALKAEIEAKVKAELEDKIRAEYEEKLNLQEDITENITVDKITTAKRIQSTIKIPLETIVPVTCNVQGGAVYTSKKINGYIVEWDEYGSTEYMELSELVSMRNTDKRFFEDNWVICEDTEDYKAIQIYDFLKVAKYYANVFTPENIDTIFNEAPKQIIKIISTLSEGMKGTIATRAKIKVDAKEIDSNSKIEALETALDVKFSI